MGIDKIKYFMATKLVFILNELFRSDCTTKHQAPSNKANKYKPQHLKPQNTSGVFLLQNAVKCVVRIEDFNLWNIVRRAFSHF